MALPMNGKAAVRGLAITVSSKWPDGRGYRPVWFDVACHPPTKEPRTISVEFSTGPWSHRKMYTVLAQIEIPAGSAGVSQAVSVPQGGVLQNWTLVVREEGVKLDDLSVEYGHVSTPDIGAWGRPQLPAILFVTDTSHDLKPLELLADGYANVGSPRNYPAGQHPNAFRDASTVATFAEQSIDRLSEGWINYSGVDVVFLSLADLRKLASGKPAVWESIREWAQTGGNLCVYGVGEKYESLAELEKLLKLHDHPPAGAPEHRNWYPNGARDGKPPAAIRVPGFALPLVGKTATKFVTHDLMMGQVAALPKDMPFPGTRPFWQAFFDALDVNRWTWQSRHGLTMDNPNLDFDNYLIAEVGLPPVNAYRVLITVFVLAIGPLNYWWLRRSRRLHLLLFTVPAAAGLISLLLVGYVVMADGLASRLRARSYTLLDQRNGESVTWSRLSYYTGLAPSAGLVFSPDVAVLPFEKLPADDQGSRGREITWDDQQRLTRGWLYSRTPTQYLTVATQSNRHGLRIAAAADQTVAVRNDLGTRIRFLVLRSKAGQPYYTKELAAGAQATLAPFVGTTITSEDFGKLNELFRDDALRTPAQLAALSKDPFGMRRSRRGGRYYHRPQGGQSSGTSLLEQALRTTNAMAPFDGLEPGSYMAVVDRPAEVSAGYEGLSESQSLHVIKGIW